MIAVEVEDEAWTTALPNVEAVVGRAAKAALLLTPFPLEGGRVGDGGGAVSMRSTDVEEALKGDVAVGARGVHLEPAPPPSPALPPSRGKGDLTVLLTDDAAVRELNARFRAKDVPTNVLSFPAPPTAAPHLGDIALAYGVCAREAAEQGKRLEQHLTHLVVHGVLHLLGYDHIEDGEAQTMEELERSLCADLGWPDPYANTPALEHHG